MSIYAVVAQSVERRPFKPVVVGSSPTDGNNIFSYLKHIGDVVQLVSTLDFESRDLGSNPDIAFGRLAQSVEHTSNKRRVGGSTPPVTTLAMTAHGVLYLYFKPIRMRFESSHSLISIFYLFIQKY